MSKILTSSSQERIIVSHVLLSSGDKYYQYEFKHQPSHEECVLMSKASPSLLFSQYTDLYCDHTWEDLFTELFGSSGKVLTVVSVVFTCVCVCVCVSNQLSFLLHIQSAVTTEALVSPVGTGRASAPL